jgi:hypothetical protein
MPTDLDAAVAVRKREAQAQTQTLVTIVLFEVLARAVVVVGAGRLGYRIK